MTRALVASSYTSQEREVQMHSAVRSWMVAVPMVLLIGCATTNTANPSKAALRIEQLPDAGFAVEERGAVSVAYQMTVENRSAGVITLRKVEMHTGGRSPYTLRKEPATMNETIEPGKTAQVIFTMWSVSQEQRTQVREMVYVNGVAYFDSEQGSFEVPFAQSFREP